MPGYTLSPAAQVDIENIWNCTAKRRGKTQAERYTRELQAACEALIDSSRVGLPANDIRSSYRKAAVDSHMTFYRLQENTVEVIRMLHQRMDVERHL